MKRRINGVLQSREMITNLPISVGVLFMSLEQSTPNSAQITDNRGQEEIQERRAYFKTSEFREAVTDAFHKAKLKALDAHAVTEEDRNAMTTPC